MTHDTATRRAQKESGPHAHGVVEWTTDVCVVIIGHDTQEKPAYVDEVTEKYIWVMHFV
jgi:hypothetical protein